MISAEPYILIMTLIFKDEKDRAFTNMNWSGAAVESVEMKSKSSCELAAREWVNSVRDKGISAKTVCVRKNPTKEEIKEEVTTRKQDDYYNLGMKYCKHLQGDGLVIEGGNWDMEGNDVYKKSVTKRVSLLKRIGYPNVNKNISYEWFIKIYNKAVINGNRLLHTECPLIVNKILKEEGYDYEF